MKQVFGPFALMVQFPISERRDGSTRAKGRAITALAFGAARAAADTGEMEMHSMMLSIATPHATAPLNNSLSSRPLLQIPVEDLLASPEQNAGMLLDVGNGVAEIFQPMRRSHDVGVDH